MNTPTPTPEIVIGLIRLVADVLENPKDEVQLAKDVLDLFMSSGVDASLLSGYLTDDAQRSADANVDIREEAKLRILDAEKNIKE